MMQDFRACMPCLLLNPSLLREIRQDWCQEWSVGTMDKDSIKERLIGHCSIRQETKTKHPSLFQLAIVAQLLDKGWKPLFCKGVELRLGFYGPLVHVKWFRCDGHWRRTRLSACMNCDCTSCCRLMPWVFVCFLKLLEVTFAWSDSFMISIKVLVAVWRNRGSRKSNSRSEEIIY